MTDKIALVVLGMHRSGTSSVAGALALLGATPPKTLLEPAADNPKGFWESRAVIEINDRILQAGESWWNDWRRFDAGKLSQNQVLGSQQEIARLLDSEFGDAPAIVLKDPRLCRLWPIWKPALTEAGYAPRCLLPIRSPLEVARSLTARNGLSLAEGLTLWLRHVLDAERDTRGSSRRILQWADFMRDWRKQLELARRSLQLDPEEPDPDAAEKVDAFLTPDLQHQHSSAEDLERADASHPWAAEAFELLKALSRDDGPDVHDQLDAFARRFEVACDLWGRALGPVLWRAHAAPIFEIERDQARAHAAALEAERAAAAAERQAQDRQAVEATDRLSRILAALQAQQAETAAAHARALQVCRRLGARPVGRSQRQRGACPRRAGTRESADKGRPTSCRTDRHGRGSARRTQRPHAGDAGPRQRRAPEGCAASVSCSIGATRHSRRQASSRVHKLCSRRPLNVSNSYRTGVQHCSTGPRPQPGACRERPRLYAAAPGSQADAGCAVESHRVPDPGHLLRSPQRERRGPGRRRRGGAESRKQRSLPPGRLAGRLPTQHPNLPVHLYLRRLHRAFGHQHDRMGARRAHRTRRLCR